MCSVQVVQEKNDSSEIASRDESAFHALSPFTVVLDS